MQDFWLEGELHFIAVDFNLFSIKCNKIWILNNMEIKLHSYSTYNIVVSYETTDYIYITADEAIGCGPSYNFKKK